MKVTIVSIGNSRGVRLPKAVLEQCNFADTAELSVENGRIVLAPVDAPRRRWAGAFATTPAGSLSEEDLDWLEAPLDSA